MKIIAKATTDGVLKFFRSELDSQEWATARIDDSDKYFQGKWSLVELSESEALNEVQLVFHHDTREGLQLIPEAGMTVSDASKRFLAISKEYRIKNHGCYNKIMVFSQRNFPAILLSSRPLLGCGIPEHSRLIYKEGSFVHLDGLHRLVGWGIARVQGERSEGKIRAYIAGL